MRSTWLLSLSAALLLLSTHVAAAPDQGAGPPAAPADHLAAAATIVGQLQAGSTHVRRGLERARAERDVIKVLCLDDKLNRLDVAARGARERREALVAAAARQEADQLTHERARLEALREGGLRVLAEADECLGSPEVGLTDKSSTQVTVSALPDTPDYPAGDDRFVASVVSMPVPSSPFK